MNQAAHAPPRPRLPFGVPVPQDILDIDDKQRSNPLPWRGQFSPQLVDALLSSYACPGATVLDPFVGSGTVVGEGARLGFRAVGVEVNPAAFLLARIYGLMNIAPNERRLLVQRVETRLRDITFAPLPLFGGPLNGTDDDEDVSTELVGVAKSESDPHVAALLCGLIVLLDIHPGRRLTRVQVRERWKTLRDFASTLETALQPAALFLGDARRIPLDDDTVDFVLTSPPYINVFNYHQNYRASTEALGWAPLGAARLEIGSNRKFRQNRFLTVAQYCLDMMLVLRDLARVCRLDARLILVVGRESNVRKTQFYNGKLVASIARSSGQFEIVQEQERAFVNKFGSRIFEDILHLVPTHCASEAPSRQTQLAAAREVARAAYEAARERAPKEAQPDLIAALEAIASVEPSAELDLNGLRPTLNNGD